MRNRPPQKEFPPTFSFEYNQQPPPQPKKRTQQQGYDDMQYITYMRPDINTALNYQSQVNPYFGYASPGYIPPVVVKNYTIQTEGITGEQRQLAVVYEDVLPQRKFAPSYTTLGERLNDYNFIRSSVLNNSDGTDIDLNSLSSNSITSYLKIDVADINPYNSYKHFKNPLMELPYGFLIYRSGYPIRHNEKTGQIECAKDSTTINLRLYKMLEGTWLASRKYNKHTNKSEFFNYDEWREVAFYEFIRETILKKKVCPNFVNMYGYFISEKSMIDYDKLDYQYKNLENFDKTIEPQFNTIEQPVNATENTQEQQNGENTVNHFVNPVQQQQQQQHPNIITLNQDKTIIEANPKAYLGKSLVILTESPTYTIFGWASKVYLENGNIYEMVGRGYHDVNTWMNVLFQMMAGLLTMQINNIYIDNFDIERNIFIKDLAFRGTTTEYWKYKINGVDYYIPNLGYLLLIDSNFRDIDFNKDSIFIEKENSHKLNGSFFDEDVAQNKMKEKTFDMFTKSFDPNLFGRYSQKYGIIQPPSEITEIMGKIFSEAKTDKNMNIEHYIIKYMNKFINNRVGTNLKDTEISNVRKNNKKTFTKGDILVLESRNGTKQFVLFLESNNGKSTIVTKDNKDQKDFSIIEVNSFSLIDYNRDESIQQIYKPNEENLTDEGLIETYIINFN